MVMFNQSGQTVNIQVNGDFERPQFTRTKALRRHIVNLVESLEHKAMDGDAGALERLEDIYRATFGDLSGVAGYNDVI